MGLVKKRGQNAFVEVDREGRFLRTDCKKQPTVASEDATFSFIVSVEDANQRLDLFLVKVLDGFTRSHIQTLIKEGHIKVNNQTSKSSYKLKEDDEVEVSIPEAKPLEVKAENIPLDIKYEDKDLLVVNKPAGMVTHPAAGNFQGTLVNALLYHCKDLSGINGVLRPGIVHRLDKDTSGLLVVAKNDEAHQSLAKQIQERSAKRQYIVLVHGKMKDDSGEIKTLYGRNPKNRKKMAVFERATSDERRATKEAITHYKVLERFNFSGKDYTLLEVTLKTGRTHQIRVHMSNLGHPIVGDKTYGYKNEKIKIDRPMLHAKTLGFVHPSSNKYIEFEQPMPKEMERIIKIVRGYG